MSYTWHGGDGSETTGVVGPEEPALVSKVDIVSSGRQIYKDIYRHQIWKDLSHLQLYLLKLDIMFVMTNQTGNTLSLTLTEVLIYSTPV